MALNYYTIIIGFVIGIILFFKLPRLSKAKATVMVKPISISVIIPARNEESNLVNLFADLKKQNYSVREIICVDDNSEDATQDIVKEYGFKYLKNRGLPDGWKGKPWACQAGAKAATGEVLLFIDADVRLSEHAIESLVIRYNECSKPISVQPYHIVKKQYEFFSFFFNLILICVTGLSLLGKKRTRGLYGPVLLISRKLFNSHGGYEVVKNSVAEDFNLGRYYNKQGINIDLLLGGKDIKFRMYEQSFADLFEGWSKNFSTGSISMQWWLLVLVFAWIAFMSVLPYEIAHVLITGNYTLLILLGLLYVLSVGLIYRAAYRIGSFPFYVCILYPIYLIMFHIIFIYSIVATFIIRSTTWKGRKL